MGSKRIYYFLNNPTVAAKRFLALLLAVLLTGGILPAHADASGVKEPAPPVLTIGDVEVTGETKAKEYGFEAMEVTGDVITLTAGEQIKLSAPLRVDGELVIKGPGNLTVDVDDRTYAIFAESGLTIRDVCVTANSSKRAAIYSAKNILIENSVVKASGPLGSKGIQAGASVEASGSWVESTGYNYELAFAEGNVIFQETDAGMEASVKADAEGTGTFVLPGSVTLPGTLEIPEGVTLVIPEDRMLTIPEGAAMAVTGTVENHGLIEVKGGLDDPDEQIINNTGDGGIGRVTGVEADEVWLETEEVLNLGESKVLDAHVVPYYAENPALVWSSSDSSVVSVTDGTIRGLRAGTAVITAKTANGKKAGCEVTVNEIAVSGVELDQTSAELFIGQELKLTETVIPESAVNKNVTWSSSSDDIASVDDEGLVTALKAGTAVITVTTEDGNKKAECSITVKAIPAEKVTLSSEKERIAAGSFLQLTATVTPENATDKTVVWSSSDDNIATVDQNGKVYAKAEGTARITVRTRDGGLTAECDLTIYVVKVKEINLNAPSSTVPLGKTLAIIPVISPADATDKNITWSSSDGEIASVDSKGIVTGRKTGTAVITAAATDGSSVVGTKEITVITIPVTEVRLDCSSASIRDNGSLELKAEVLPADATNKRITWKSDNPQAAVVDASGKVTAVKAGTANITVTTADGNKMAVCTVTVTAPDRAENTAALNKGIKLIWNTKKRGMVISWGKAPDAEGYEIFAAQCGDDVKLVKTVPKANVNSLTLKKIGGKKLKAQKTYKVQVKAYRIFQGKKQYLGKSYSVHIASDTNRKYTNVKKLTVPTGHMTLKTGKLKKLRVQTVRQDKKKKLVNHVETVRYFTSDKKVAAVSKYGTVRAVGKGRCTIYAVAVNGVKIPVKVTVKE